MSNSTCNQFVSEKVKVVNLKDIGASNGTLFIMCKEEVILISSSTTCPKNKLHYKN